MSLPEINSTLKMKNIIKKNTKKSIIKALMFLYSYKPHSYSKVSKKIMRNLQKKIENKFGVKKKKKEKIIPKRKKKRKEIGMIRYKFQNKSDEDSPKERKLKREKSFIINKFSSFKNSSEDLDESIPSSENSNNEYNKKRKGIFINTNRNKSLKKKKTLKLKKKKKTVKFTTKVKNKKELNPLDEDSYRIKNSPNNQGTIIIKKFGMIVYDKDLFGFKTKKIVSKNILNFFSNQLSYKSNQKILNKGQKRSFFFNSLIMEKFTHNLKLTSDFCDFQIIKNDLYNISNKKSILDIYNIICIPFETKNFGFKLVVVDIDNSKLIYFDPLKVTKMKDEENYGFKYIHYVMKFLNLEYKEKTRKLLNKKWKIVDRNNFPFTNFSENTFYIAFYIYSIYKSRYNPNPTKKNIEDFYFILLKYLLK